MSNVMNTYNRWPITVDYGDGSYIWDIDGTRYLDFTSGIAVNLFGHNYTPIVKVISEQAGKLLHVSNLFQIPSQLELADNLTNEAGYGKVFFANSGAEANEAAIKLARRYHQKLHNHYKYEIITFNKSFHGRTLTTITATAQPKYQEGFHPLPEGFIYCPFNDIKAVEAAITDKTAAIMFELIQGEGGVHEIDRNFLSELQDLADRKDILLIVDEVQTGMYRAGTMFLWQQYDFQPDIFTLAKGLGGGVPIGACIAKDHVAKAFVPGTHASTFGGNPLVTTVSNTIIKELQQPAIKKQIKTNIVKLETELQTLKQNYPDKIKEIRGRGLLRGIELAADLSAIDIVNHCREENLLLVAAGDNTIRFLPPLNTNDEEIDQAIEIFGKCLVNA